jgi:uncharacterized protein (UPF0333 family)
MESKGQVSAEYLLLLVVILIILAVVTMPLIGSSVTGTLDVSKASDTKNAIQSIANAVNIVYANGPGAKRTINLYIPQNGNLSVNNNAKVIYQILPLSSQNKTINASIDYSTTIINPSPVLQQGWHQTKIEWPSGTNTNITVSFLT